MDDYQVAQREKTSKELFGSYDLSKFSVKEIYEFQALGKEIMEYTGWKGNKVFPLFYDIRYNERKIRDAFIAYKRGNVKTFRYFMGILKNTK